MASVEERLSVIESTLDDLKRQLAGQSKPKTWLDKVTGSMKDYPEFDEVLRLGREYRNSVTDSIDAEIRES